MTPSDAPPAARLMGLINGYQVSQAIHVAATLRIADQLRDGPRTTQELAEATNTHARSLYRLLRALASVGVFREEPGERFSLTELGGCLRSDAPVALGPWAVFIGRQYYWETWGHLLHSVRTGKNAFPALHDGMNVWEWRSQRPEESAIFDAAMAGLSRGAPLAVLGLYDFGRFARVVDVGGGTGAFLAAVLSRHPGTRGVLFDQPHVVTGAGPVLEAAGVADRCEVAGGSFFESVPSGADAYVLKAILHDWDDEASARILRTVRRACGPESMVLIVERAVAPPNEGAPAKFSDLNMLVSPGGQERTNEEWKALLAAGGFRMAGAVETPTGFAVVEGVPA